MIRSLLKLQMPCSFLMCHSAKTDWPFKSCSKSKDSSLWRSPFVEGIHLVIATAFIVAINLAGVIIIDCILICIDFSILYVLRYTQKINKPGD